MEVNLTGDLVRSPIRKDYRVPVCGLAKGDEPEKRRYGFSDNLK